MQMKQLQIKITIPAQLTKMSHSIEPDEVLTPLTLK